MSKILRYTITILIILFTILQIPYCKAIFLKKLLTKINKESTITIYADKLTGVLPFYISLENCSISTDKEKIIHAENISLLWSTPLPLFSKNIPIDRLYIKSLSLPIKNSNEKKEPFGWPKFPWGIKIKKIILDTPNIEGIQDKVLRLSADIKKNGSFTIELQYQESINGRLTLKGDVTNNKLKVVTSCRLLEQSWLDPSIELKADIETDWENFIGFIDSKRINPIEGSFSYSIKRFQGFNKLYHYSKKIFGDKWHQEGTINIDTDRNLNLFFIPNEQKALTLSGSATINPQMQFQRTRLAGSIKDIGLLKSFFKREIKGTIDTELLLSGDIFAPKYKISLSSPHIDLDGKNIAALTLSLENTFQYSNNKISQHLSGILNLSAIIDNIPIKIISEADCLDQKARQIKISVDEDYILSGKVQAHTEKESISLSLSEGVYQSFREGTLIEGLHGTMLYNDKVLSLDRLYSNNPNSKVSISGETILSSKKNFPVKIDIEIDRLKAIDSDKITAIVKGKGHIDGSLLKPKIHADLKVEESTFRLSEKQAETIPSIEIEFMDDPPSTVIDKEHFSPMLDINLDIPGNLFIKQGKELSVECQGKLRLHGPLLNPEFKGHIEKSNGFFLFAGKVFDITEGTINFNGRSPEKIHLKASAKTHINNLEIFISMSGPLSDLNLRLSSNPSVPLQDILANILFNSTSDQISTLQAIRLAQLMISFSEKQLTPDILNSIVKSVGLDFIEININDRETNESDDQDVSIDIGKYIYKNILFIFHKEIMDDSNSLGIEANLGKRFKVEANVDDNSEGELIIRWNKRY